MSAEDKPIPLEYRAAAPVVGKTSAASRYSLTFMAGTAIGIAILIALLSINGADVPPLFICVLISPIALVYAKLVGAFAGVFPSPIRVDSNRAFEWLSGVMGLITAHIPTGVTLLLNYLKLDVSGNTVLAPAVFGCLLASPYIIVRLLLRLTIARRRMNEANMS